MFEIKRRLRVLLISPDFDNVFVLIDNHVFFIVPYSQQCINTSLTTLGNGMFSCGQNLSLNFYFNSTKYSIESDKTNELSHQI